MIRVFSVLFTTLLPIFILWAEAHKLPGRGTPAPFSDFTNNAVFWPPSSYPSWRTLYARTLQLPDESLLITWEDYPPEPLYFPIYRSKDGGATWSEYSRVYDQVNGWGLRYQPFLYSLPQRFGDYPKGTILIAGPSTPANLSGVYIDVYASRTNGRTWEFVSHIAHGGLEVAANGDKAIWEPFFMVYNNELICYYSDQRDPKHGQKLVHTTTKDLKKWTDPIDDVALDTYTERPGMTTVAHIESTNKYIMTFEYGGGPVNGNMSTYDYPVFYKVADSPLEFGKAGMLPIISNDGSQTIPIGSPYVLWTPKPYGKHGEGVLMMNAASSGKLFINDDSAGVDGWRMVDVGQQKAYSRSLRIIDVLGKRKLLLGNGGNMTDIELNHVQVGVVEIPS